MLASSLICATACAFAGFRLVPLGVSRTERCHGISMSAGTDDDELLTPKQLSMWRKVRSQLVASEGEAVPAAPCEDEEVDLWSSHHIASPEIGCLLVARPNVEFTGQPMLQRSVVLLLEHSAHGSVGIMLNRPTETVLRDVSDSLESDLSDAFERRPLHVGGSSFEGPANVWLLASLRECDGFDAEAEARQLVPGLWLAPADEAAQRVKSGRASADRFHFFAGSLVWDAGQLEEEIEAGAWATLSVPAPILSTHMLGGELSAEAKYGAALGWAGELDTDADADATPAVTFEFGIAGHNGDDIAGILAAAAGAAEAGGANEVSSVEKVGAGEDRVELRMAMEVLNALRKWVLLAKGDLVDMELVEAEATDAATADAGTAEAAAVDAATPMPPLGAVLAIADQLLDVVALTDAAEGQHAAQADPSPDAALAAWAAAAAAAAAGSEGRGGSGSDAEGRGRLDKLDVDEERRALEAWHAEVDPCVDHLAHRCHEVRRRWAAADSSAAGLPTAEGWRGWRGRVENAISGMRGSDADAPMSVAEAVEAMRAVLLDDAGARLTGADETLDVSDLSIRGRVRALTAASRSAGWPRFAPDVGLSTMHLGVISLLIARRLGLHAQLELLPSADGSPRELALRLAPTGAEIGPRSPEGAPRSAASAEPPSHVYMSLQPGAACKVVTPPQPARGRASAAPGSARNLGAISDASSGVGVRLDPLRVAGRLAQEWSEAYIAANRPAAAAFWATQLLTLERLSSRLRHGEEATAVDAPPPGGSGFGPFGARRDGDGDIMGIVVSVNRPEGYDSDYDI